MQKVLTVSGILSTVAVVSMALMFGCRNETPLSPEAELSPGISFPSTAPQPQGLAKIAKTTRIYEVMGVQNRHTRNLMEKEGVVGTATGLNDNGALVVLVFVKEEKHKFSVPASLEDVPVVIEVTGEFHALDRAAVPLVGKVPGGSTAISHTNKQIPPVKLGTSGGWTYDLANGYCCGGTLGSLVTDGVKKFILSNYHVFQADIVDGGNSRVAAAGDPIVQPGLLDVNCNAAAVQTVATLSMLSFPATLPNSNVDASIAEIVPGMVSDSILEIGMISNVPAAAFIGQTVKKSGRTTKLTRSTVSGLNATIVVAYDNECAGGAAFTKTYTGQIVVKNSRSAFLKGGDSGSLLVEDKAAMPRAVGLLFAGSTTTAVANPINDVLNHFGTNFSMVGN